MVRGIMLFAENRLNKSSLLNKDAVMYILNGIAYAGEMRQDLAVSAVNVLADGILIVTFSTGEERLFDTTKLLRYPAFASIQDTTVQSSAKIENGILTWDEGRLDYATEALYKESIPYASPARMAC